MHTALKCLILPDLSAELPKRHCRERALLQIPPLSQSALEAQKAAPSPSEPSRSPMLDVVQSGDRHAKATTRSSHRPASPGKACVTAAGSAPHPEAASSAPACYSP